MADLAVVWKLSITKNDYKCTKCGRKLLDTNTNSFTDGAGLDPDDMEAVHCMNCGLLVGLVREAPHGDIKRGKIQQFKGVG